MNHSPVVRWPGACMKCTQPTKLTGMHISGWNAKVLWKQKKKTLELVI